MCCICTYSRLEVSEFNKIWGRGFRLEQNILFSSNQNGLAEITLNRPKAINSLTYDMLEPLKEKLIEWEKNPEIKVIILKGAGEKGFCAGGDMKTLYDAGQNGDAIKKGDQFFNLEYEVDQLIYDFSKPIVACLDGIVMGGGVGLAYGASHRIVTERTKWAMPEMNIGFFPDVGAAYFLNQAPGKIGRYLALTSAVINGAEALYIQAADYFLSQKNLSNFVEELKTTNWHPLPPEKTLEQLIDEYVSNPTDKGDLKGFQNEIDEHFRFDSIEEIVASLLNGTSPFASDTAKEISSKSPVSLKVTLKQLIDGEGKSLSECLDTDLVIAKNFMTHDDFFEGVRSVLIDKDHTPVYEYNNINDVPEELVNQFFK